MAVGDVGFLSKMERFMLRKRFKKYIVQGYQPQLTVAGLYDLIREVWEEEFPEENWPTVDFNLREAFEASQHDPKLEGIDAETVEFIRGKLETRREEVKRTWISI